MSLGKYFSVWRDYHIRFFDKCIEDGEHFVYYKLQDLGCKFGEGLLLGGIGYYLTDNLLPVILGPVITLTGRDIHLKRHIERNLDYYKNKSNG